MTRSPPSPGAERGPGELSPFAGQAGASRIGAGLLLAALAGGARAAPGASVPFFLDHNRVLVEALLPLPDGRRQAVRAWVDTGNPEMWLTARLARLLELEPLPGEAVDVLGVPARRVRPPPSLAIGGLEVSLRGIEEALAVEGADVAPGVEADLNLPASALRRLDVVLDYVDQTLALAAPGGLAFEGRATPAFLSAGSGLLVVPARLAGRTVPLALDTGACFSMLSEELLDRLAAEHPRWPSHRGAVGPENFWGLPEEAGQRALRVPALAYGGAELLDVGFVSLSRRWLPAYQAAAGAGALGLVGGDALLGFRVGLDYARGRLHLERRVPTTGRSIDTVGLTLRPRPGGSYGITGVARHGDASAAPGVRAGDELLAVDGIPVQGRTMGEVVALLAGKPGDARTLTLERSRERATVRVRVRRFLPGAR